MSSFRYPSLPSIPLRSQQPVDFVNAFESGRQLSESRRNRRRGIDATTEYFGSIEQQPQMSLASLAPQQPAPQQPKSPGNSIFSQFMSTVKQGGVTNPNALAAIAATGKRESGFSPENVGRVWSDPSETGQPGMAGGIMSWRGDRLRNLQSFAAQNGDEPSNPSPETQAKFLLAEDPQLIQSLNQAKSPQEAAELMANAWRFAGYNREGGEAEARQNLTNQFVSEFGGQSQQPAPGAPQGGGQLAQLAAGALGAQGFPMPTKEQFRSMMQFEATRPLAMRILQARTTGDQRVAKSAFDMALKLDNRQRSIDQQDIENRRADVGLQSQLDQRATTNRRADETLELRKRELELKAQGGEKPNFDDEHKLRKDFQAVTKDFRSVRDASSRVEASAKDPSPAGDLALIFNYMKILDPGSVVRESEFATAAASGSYGERLKAAGERILSGERLSQVMREDFLNRARGLFKERQNQYAKTEDEFRGLARAYSLDEDRVVLDFNKTDSNKIHDASEYFQ